MPVTETTTYIRERRGFLSCGNRDCPEARLPKRERPVRSVHYFTRTEVSSGHLDGRPWTKTRRERERYATQEQAELGPWKGQVLRFRCPACGMSAAVLEVEGIRRDEIPCDRRCTGARGHRCECSCGGLNHGADHDDSGYYNV